MGKKQPPKLPAEKDKGPSKLICRKRNGKRNENKRNQNPEKEIERSPTASLHDNDAHKFCTYISK